MVLPLDSDVEQAQSLQEKPIFSISISSPSRCRGCKFYQFQGSRGGHCHKLGVGVHGHWEACSLAMSPFPVSWKPRQDLKINNLPTI